MEAMWKANSVSPKTTDGMHTEASLADSFTGVKGEHIDNTFDDEDFSSDVMQVDNKSNLDNGKLELKGFDHEDFLRGDKGDAKLKEGDDGYDEEMGAASQLVQLACDAVDESNLVSSGNANNDSSEDLEAALISEVRKSVGLERIASESTSTTKEAFNMARANHEKLSCGYASYSFQTASPRKQAQEIIKIDDVEKGRCIEQNARCDQQPLEWDSWSGPSRGNVEITTKSSGVLMRRAKQSLPSFSSRAMLYVPSYLKDTKER
jgi:hypothetical protein